MKRVGKWFNEWVNKPEIPGAAPTIGAAIRKMLRETKDNSKEESEALMKAMNNSFLNEIETIKKNSKLIQDASERSERSSLMSVTQTLKETVPNVDTMVSDVKKQIKETDQVKGDMPSIEEIKDIFNRPEIQEKLNKDPKLRDSYEKLLKTEDDLTVSTFIFISFSSNFVCLGYKRKL